MKRLDLRAKKRRKIMSDLRTLGIDTSNYTCSTAVYNAANGSIVQAKQLLPVKAGEKGIRQSDAFFITLRFCRRCLKG